MAAGKFRPGPWANIFRGFINSLKGEKAPKQGSVQVGSDPFGNRYFEIPADPRRGKRQPIRWYDAPETNKKDVIGRDTFAGFDATIPAEWDSWLRMRRDEPPSPEQVMNSLALADLKKRNAAQLDEKNREKLLAMGREVPGEVKPQEGEKPFWPKRDEYEVMPGEPVKNDDKWADFKNPYAKDTSSGKQ